MKRLPHCGCADDTERVERKVTVGVSSVACEESGEREYAKQSSQFLVVCRDWKVCVASIQPIQQSAYSRQKLDAELVAMKGAKR